MSIFGLHLTHGLALTLLVPLAPLLWAQGVHTRRKTPVLPEPPGPRSGRAGAGPVLRLLIAGDSAAAGVGVDHQDEALCGQLQALLTPRFDLQWELIARTGHTTADLLECLHATPPARGTSWCCRWASTTSPAWCRCGAGCSSSVRWPPC